MIAGARQQTSDWWGGRTPRERWLLGIGGAVLSVWLVFTLILLPIEAARDAATRQIALYERAIAALAAGPAPVAAAPTDTRPLNVIVTEAAGAVGLTIRRIEPEGDRVRVTLDQAAFQTVVLWIEAMARDSGLRATEIELSRRPAPGVVNATLVLER